MPLPEGVPLSERIRPYKTMLAWHFALYAFINAVTWLLVSMNAEAGFYPPDADSLGIPFGLTLLLTLILAAVLVLVTALRVTATYFRLEPPRALRAALLVLSQVPMAFLCLWGFAYWATPAHLPLSASYVVLFVLSSTWLLRDLKGEIRTP